MIAALLAFILSPLIRRLRQWGVWRAPSVVLAVVFTLGVLGALGTIIAIQITQLAEELPTYETNLRTKIRALGTGGLTSGALERASGTLKDLQEEIGKAPPRATAGQKPMLVEVRQPEPRGLETIATLVRPLLSPLAMTALIVLFLIFILLQREDLRDRFLRLAGTADLQRSTAALDDAGARLSRFFLMQTILNAGFGVVIAAGLWLIGVPNAVLWGIFAGLMRFVPFVGGIIAAFFPMLLAAAVDPGWSGDGNRRAFPCRGTRCGTPHRAARLWPAHGAVSGCPRCVDPLLDAAVGSRWPTAGYAADGLSGGPW